MDKNGYETYEYLPSSNVETDADQFFIVQDDGTFLINRPVQYVTQVQNGNESESMQPCTVYDASSQSYYINVDNTTELITVPEQYILQDDNSLYSNNYLLQPEPNVTSVQIGTDEITSHYKEIDAPLAKTEADNLNDKQTANICTEITLSDEEYKMLEENGWVLLESNDKIFLLNTLGLHDITTNEKLIQKLKTEIKTKTESDTGCIKYELNQLNNEAGPSNQEMHALITNNNIDQSKDISETLPLTTYPEVSVDKPEAPTLLSKKDNELNDIKTNIVKNEVNDISSFKPDDNSDLSWGSVRIKTKYVFKDIPNKIYLGKTLNGKRLFAKVTKSKNSKKNKEVIIGTSPSTKLIYKKLEKSKQYHNAGLTDSNFLSLIQQCARGTIQSIFSPDDLASIDNVINQLLRVPNLKTSIIEHNLVITKVTNVENKCGSVITNETAKLITGRVIMLDEQNGRFIHMPCLLQDLVDDRNVTNSYQTQKAAINNSENRNIDIFHIHICEAKCTDNIVRVSVTLNRQKLSMDIILDLKIRHPNAVYACSACAAIFKSETELTKHQENECMETDDTLTIDTDNFNHADVNSMIIRNEKEDTYACSQCDAKFNKIRYCRRHVQTHLLPKTSDLNGEASSSDTEKQTNEVHKCRMCPSTYFHRSTLSKHILAKHINVKRN